MNLLDSIKGDSGLIIRIEFILLGIYIFYNLHFRQ